MLTAMACQQMQQQVLHLPFGSQPCGQSDWSSTQAWATTQAAGHQCTTARMILFYVKNTTEQYATLQTFSLSVGSIANSNTQFWHIFPLLIGSCATSNTGVFFKMLLCRHRSCSCRLQVCISNNWLAPMHMNIAWRPGNKHT